MYKSNDDVSAAIPNNNNPEAEEISTIESESSSLTEEAPPPGYARYEDSLEDLLGDDGMYDRGGGFGMCLQSKYGAPELNAKRAAELLPPGEEGMVWHARLVKTLRDVPRKDLDEVNQCIKPRRASLMVLADDFFSSLIKTDEKQPRWLFSGVLNGWPSLALLEVQSITVSIKGTIVPSMKRGIAPVTRRTWSYKKEGLKGIAPSFPKAKLGIIRHEQVRVRLRAPGWTSKGWSKNSPGYAWWFEANREKPRLLHGLDMIRIPQKEIGETVDPICTHVHMFSHRYAVGGRKMENPKERFTYHSAILLEWDHKKYVTVVELALLNGLSGYSGKSNWYDDKNANPSLLYETFPRRMVAPWTWSLGEIRCLDVEAKTFEEFKEYVHKYSGHEHRFVDPRFSHSHPVRICFRHKSHISQYLLNYIGRDQRYSEVNRNCQTFAADLFGFLAGKKGVEPFIYFQRIDYTNRSHCFLYDSKQFL